MHKKLDGKLQKYINVPLISFELLSFQFVLILHLYCSIIITCSLCCIIIICLVPLISFVFYTSLLKLKLASSLVSFYKTMPSIA